MNDRVQTGFENGVEWKVDDSQFNPIIIEAKSSKGERREVYQCWHEPIFGYDVDDTANVNRILDRFIKELATSEGEK